MADDVFGLDPAHIESVTKGLEAVYTQSGRAKDQIYAMQGALEAIGKVGAKTAELRIMDTEQTKEILDVTKELEKRMIALGIPFKKILDAKRESRQLIGAELVDMRNLTKEAKKRVREEAQKLEFGEKYAKVGGQLIKIQQGETTSAKDAVSAFKDKGKRVAQYAAGLANVQLSLAGILAIIIQALDKFDRLGGMSRQVVEQWKGGGKALRGVASKEIMGIQAGFKKALDVAGPYAISLARAGFEQKNLVNLSKELQAVEFRTGQSVQEQVGYIKGLIANFNLADVEATNYLETVRTASKTIPMLSMSEATQDWAELIDKTKVFNTDLLGTLSLYNALMRKDIAEELGLGDAPRVVRKEIVKTVAGFSRDLEDGWKAALGRGTTAAARMIEFEDILPEEQFMRMAEFITEKTQGFAGAQRELASRKILEQMGFAKEARVELARAFAEGGFDRSGLTNMMKALNENRIAMEKTQKDAKTNREKLIKDGMRIASLLTGLLDELRLWLERVVIKLGRIIRLIEQWMRKKGVEPAEVVGKAIQKEEALSVITGKPLEKTLPLERRKRFHELMGDPRGLGIPSQYPEMAKYAKKAYKETEEGSEHMLPHIKKRKAIDVGLTEFLISARRGASGQRAFDNALAGLGTAHEEEAIRKLINWAKKAERLKIAVKGNEDPNANYSKNTRS